MGCGASAPVTASAPGGKVQHKIQQDGLPLDWLTVKTMNVDHEMYPENSTYEQIIEFNEEKLVHGVGVVTDWWQKRPTSVRLHEVKAGRKKGEMIGGKDCRTYLDNSCGPEFNGKCECPGPNDKALLKTNLAQPKKLNAVYVEIDGLLSSGNNFAIIGSIIVY